MHHTHTGLYQCWQWKTLQLTYNLALTLCTGIADSWQLTITFIQIQLQVEPRNNNEWTIEAKFWQWQLIRECKFLANCLSSTGIDCRCCGPLTSQWKQIHCSLADFQTIPRNSPKVSGSKNGGFTIMTAKSNLLGWHIAGTYTNQWLLKSWTGMEARIYNQQSIHMCTKTCRCTHTYTTNLYMYVYTNTHTH